MLGFTDYTSWLRYSTNYVFGSGGDGGSRFGIGSEDGGGDGDGE